MANNEFNYEDEDMITMPEPEQTETGKLQDIEADIQEVLERLEEIVGQLEEIDGDKLQEEWESNPDDEGYSADAPQEFADAVRYAIEQLEGRYDNL